MKNILNKLIILWFILPQAITSQQMLEFLPSGLQFMPLKANHQEARLGVLYFPRTGFLKVDIGNNVDLIKYYFNDSASLSSGIEFMAYALSTNYQGKRLQIDAIDGFFGGNANLQIKSGTAIYQLRLRVIHNSAHFVDGHYDNINDRWKDNIGPIPFTQDFGEITFAHTLKLSEARLRYYAGVAYATLVRPHLIKKYSFNAGFEISTGKITGKFLNRDTNIFIAHHNRYAGMPDYKLSYNNMLGIKFGGWYEKGIIFYLSHYHGNDIFSEYYARRITRIGAGFFVDFL
ncbi:MAG: hypothetical protein JW995_09240 [Melioribacteraceae bacterium]|nr:hypothetical protein [Melioribacteraceae bacterium]